MNVRIALTHNSYIFDTNGGGGYKNTFNSDVVPFQDTSYELYEALGDGLLKAYLTIYIEQKCKLGTIIQLPRNLNANKLTVIRSKMEKTSTLSDFTKSLGLDKFILIGRKMEESNDRLNDDTLSEDVFEAFIYAIFISSKRNWELTYNIMSLIFDKYFDWSRMLDDVNYRSLLSIYSIKNIGKYCTLKVDTSTRHSPKIYTVYIYHPTTNQLLGKSYDRIKNIATQNASRDALRTLHLIELGVSIESMEIGLKMHIDVVEAREKKYKDI